MRSAVSLVAALAGAVALGGCSADPAAPVSAPPAVETVSPGATEPPPTVDVEPVTPDDAQPEETPATIAPGGESPTTLAPVEQPTQQGGPWTELDLTLRSASDVTQHPELPESFREFLISRIGIEDEAGCTVESVDVRGIHPDGFAFGTEESNCGGLHTVWGIADSQWGYIVAFLDAPPCADIADNKIPVGAPGLRCTEDGAARDY